MYHDLCLLFSKQRYKKIKKNTFSLFFFGASSKLTVGTGKYGWPVLCDSQRRKRRGEACAYQNLPKVSCLCACKIRHRLSPCELLRKTGKDFLYKFSACSSALPKRQADSYRPCRSYSLCSP
ncbi:hypothetical protein EVA_13658 [gut metagenome]|uniref:Uncharacterized protein n=1 Tax=gut metagenome TaxID=749906 RepID=J9CE27_9ZZZZ